MEGSECFLVKMDRWADFLISEVSYDTNHKISQAKVHVDKGNYISDGEIIDRRTIAHNIKKGKSYITIYKTLTAWRKGEPVRTFHVDSEYSLRIDNNKVTLDFLGSIPEIGAHKEELPQIEEKPAPPKSEAKPEPQKEEPKPIAVSRKTVAYCVKCKEKREIKDAIQTTMKNGRPAIKGTCSICSAKVYRIGKI